MLYDQAKTDAAAEQRTIAWTKGVVFGFFSVAARIAVSDSVRRDFRFAGRRAPTFRSDQCLANESDADSLSIAGSTAMLLRRMDARCIP